MGITRLLPMLASITRPRHIRELAGQTAGIDGHVWLHRSIFSNAEVYATGLFVDSHIKYFLRRTRLLSQAGIHPIFVFDGADLPAKLLTRRIRDSGRVADMARAIALKESGDGGSAYCHFAKAAEISAEMVHDIVEALNAAGIKAVVSPYEADAQLTYMARSGLIDLVISEDSDLLVYGCPSVLFKLDPLTGYGLEVSSPISEAAEFQRLCPDSAVLACILAGCDYGPTIPGVGIKRAIDIAADYRSMIGRPHQVLPLLIEGMQTRGFDIPAPAEVIEAIRTSQLVFRYQTVFDPVLKRLRPLNLPGSDTLFDERDQGLVGHIYDDTAALGVYLGHLHPVTKSTFAPKDSPRMVPCATSLTPTGDERSIGFNGYSPEALM